MSKKVLKKVTKKFKDQIVDSHDRLGDETIIIEPSSLREICEYLYEDDKMAFDFLQDITAVDYLKRKPRFEVVYHLYSMEKKHRLRIRVIVEEGEDTEVVPTVSDIWRAADWGEREVWDMYGIRFEGHPNMRRILMYEEFEGYPLRKDYPIQLSQPRMDIEMERDAIEEYEQFFLNRDGNSPVE
jgi:NADH-quinone oxidoreductase subunit C